MSTSGVDRFQAVYGFKPPTKFEVCPRCQGRGVHDCWEGGMTGDEMAEQGPEFFEDYMNGVYSVRCTECNGDRVVEVIDEKRCYPEFLDQWNEFVETENEIRAQYESERRAGA